MDARYVYFLRSALDDSFKVGVSLDPVRRAAVLPQEIDIHRSLRIPMLGGNAFKVEKLLHYMFRDYSVVLEKCDGFSEWFKPDAWALMLEFLSRHGELLGVGSQQTIACGERPAVKRRNREVRVINSAEHNAEMLGRFSVLMGEIELSGCLRGFALQMDSNPFSCFSMFLRGAEIERIVEECLNLTFFGENPRAKVAPCPEFELSCDASTAFGRVTFISPSDASILSLSRAIPALNSFCANLSELIQAHEVESLDELVEFEAIFGGSHARRPPAYSRPSLPCI
ncbi:GIY-YIG nuclease family protein [Xanthomonas euvesicatoria]|uniref:GIY-YIG nuclease family protein n=1 Tax=Xanthomonas euvesicatoria TaxID=456327 RepID=UPI0009BF2181|nr:GIY-YIG nuclease family protein [Xanthomonas euvesicatoria]